MDIFECLETDHDLQRDLLDRLAATSGDTSTRRALWRELVIEVEAHANAEEQTLYATLLEDPETQQRTRHGVHEHIKATELIDELTELNFDSREWTLKFEQLRDALEHHLREEEAEVFPLASRHLSGGEARVLGIQFRSRKNAEAGDVAA